VIYIEMKRKVVHAITSASHREDGWGSGGVAPPFLTSALDEDQ
jgi:hypothetical protein